MTGVNEMACLIHRRSASFLHREICRRVVIAESTALEQNSTTHLIQRRRRGEREAVLIHGFVAERFGDALRIGIGINTCLMIAGTIGGGGSRPPYRSSASTR